MRPGQVLIVFAIVLFSALFYFTVPFYELMAGESPLPDVIVALMFGISFVGMMSAHPEIQYRLRHQMGWKFEAVYYAVSVGVFVLPVLLNVVHVPWLSEHRYWMVLAAFSVNLVWIFKQDLYTSTS